MRKKQMLDVTHPGWHTRKYVETLYPEDELLCLTMLDGDKRYGRVTIGYYWDRENFYRDVLRLNTLGNIYINLHKIDPDLFGRVANRYQPHSKVRYTSSEVIWRPRLVIDLDPKRLSGINSTDEELRAALDLAPKVADYVESEFGETPLVTASGNGAQLVVKIDEPPESKLSELFLKHLDRKFSDARVTVDTSCHDLPRIVRLPGTLNCKGDSIEGRPRRYAQILGVTNATQF
jgi:hypothetical protein